MFKIKQTSIKEIDIKRETIYSDAIRRPKAHFLLHSVY